MRTINEEEVDLSESEDFSDAMRGLGRSPDDVYDRKRIHSSPGYLTPSGFEQQWISMQRSQGSIDTDVQKPEWSGFRAALPYAGFRVLVALVLVVGARPSSCLGAGDVIAPEERAVAYLAREVPRWSAENRCFSCHNNGDGARALFMASGGSGKVPGEALAETTRWLAKPEGWDHNGGDGPSADKKLARVQFAAASAEAVAVGRVADRSSLLRAAVRLAEDQAEDGSWRLDEEESLGSPATYGVPLATFTALEVLRAADPEGTRFRGAIERADRWLSRREPGSTLDAAAGLLALGSRADPASASRRRRLLDFLRAGRSDDGGWGPYRDSPPEPFDTAVVLLALARKRDEPGSEALIRGGRASLISAQRIDGSWPETTRPPGAESYAQRVSTTSWATRALLATRGGTTPP